MKQQIQNIRSRWSGMRQRCVNKNNPAYKYYGARGIKVCDEWQDFDNFFRDMGFPPEGMTLDRIDCNGNYCKENCRWATTKEQGRNRRHVTIFDGKTAREMSVDLGGSETLVCLRLLKGWSIEKAFNTPKNPKRKLNEGIRGIDYVKKHNRWRARYLQKGKDIHIGHFLTKEEALLALNKYEYHEK